MKTGPKQKIFSNAVRVGFFGSLGGCLSQLAMQEVPIDPVAIAINGALIFVFATVLYFFWGLIRGSN